MNDISNLTSHMQVASGVSKPGRGSGQMSEQMVQQRLDRIQAGIESGSIDVEQFKARMEYRFGEAAANIVDENGFIDFSQVENLFQSQTSSSEQMLQQRMEKLQAGIESGDIDVEQLKSHMQARFGDKAGGLFGDSGNIDFSALEDLISQMFDEDEPENDPLIDMSA